MTRQEYKDVYEVVGAAMEVHKTLGRGMAEAIYQEALAVEMKKRGLIVEREKELRLSYKDVLLEKVYFADMFYQGIIIELKSVENITSEHRAQLFNYMRLLRLPYGILVNFTPNFAEIERYFLDLITMEIVGTDGKVKQFL
jgi:GxxExxY protein